MYELQSFQGKILVNGVYLFAEFSNQNYIAAGSDNPGVSADFLLDAQY
jgi:hypothetical protein